ncbi:MAG: cyclopropane-fatty-acyl-phospholipid synthase family protein [Acidobacteriota bacterium]|nr:cyclopropane-fatty-acyl-phospholipid synthase family protein [Acidobacteriota bacterium]
MQTAADWMGEYRDPRDVAGSTERTAAPAAASTIDRWALDRIHGHLNDPAITLTLWDGTSLGPPAAAARAAVRIADRGALYGLIWDTEIAFGDHYSDGRIEVTGDLVYLLEAAYRAPAGTRRWYPHASAITRGRARDNVHVHYDLGNEFYALWLDEQMVYTCAYYPSPHLTIEQAQNAKLDLVCRKLDLQPGLRVVEAGSGWGALALHMARNYGVTVKAYNVSREQTAYARQRAAEEGLAERVEFIEDDYRAITGTFDRFAAIGMLEHVGLAQFSVLGAVIDRVLDPVHGRGLLHFIGRNQAAPLSRWITKRIFPGAYPPTLAETFDRVLAPWRLSVLDVENLRLHYARTLEAWGSRYETAQSRVELMYGPRFARAWRLYLAGSKVAFTSGMMQLFQVSFAREQDNTVPWTRASLYDAHGAGARP